MARRTPRPLAPSGASVASPAASPPIVHSSVYLPGPVHDALREIAYRERIKIHDVIIEGIDAALRRRGYPSIDKIKAGKRQ
jgi:hypothetical protein